METYVKWEYFTFFVDPPETEDQKLNDFGNLGWELVSVVKINVGYIIYFKRILKPKSENPILENKYPFEVYGD